jgi:hypothetical protein
MVMESKQSKNSYRTLSFFCDWYVHGNIDRHPRAWDILAKIDDQMFQSSSQDPRAVVYQLLRVDELRSQFIELFRSHSINPFLFTENDNWSAFAGTLFGDLCQRPIRWPEDITKDRKAKQVFDAMMKGRSLRSDLYPKSLFVDHRLDGHDGRGLYWTVVLADDPHDVICSGLLIETREPGTEAATN